MLENSLSSALVQMLSKVKVESARYHKAAERRMDASKRLRSKYPIKQEGVTERICSAVAVCQGQFT